MPDALMCCYDSSEGGGEGILRVLVHHPFIKLKEKNFKIMPELSLSWGFFSHTRRLQKLLKTEHMHPAVFVVTKASQ